MFTGSMNIVSLALVILTGVVAAANHFFYVNSIGTSIAIVIVGLLVTASPRLINDWERGVLLRLGKFKVCSSLA